LVIGERAGIVRAAMSKAFILLAAITSLIACRPGDSGEGPDATPSVDAAADGTGCTALTPRTAALEAFVGPSGLEQRMAALFDNAKTSLDVQMYLWTVQGLANKLVAAKNRGVAVRVLLDPDHAGNDNVRPIFTSGGVAWKNAPALFTYAHAKYIIVDKTQVAIMSMNFNVDAMLNERNYGVIDRDPEDIADVQAIFEYDWAVASGATSVAPANLACTRLVVSPTNSKQRLVDHINSAQATLDVEVMYISEADVRTAIINAKNRGVAVRVILQDSADSSVPALRAAGIPIKTATSFYLHSKLLIADQVAFVGSENMSFTSLAKNREVGVMAFEPTAFAPIRQQFDTDWNGAQVVP
jgi:phosphatidylserine/phosphatidylglycerophosphate/cardiolipin synthase-like enzyme